MATPAPSLPKTLVNIGLDFGTSGTKVVVRRLEKDRPAWAIDFGTDLTGFSRFSLPSTVAIKDSRFLFGIEAENHRGSSVWRSLKRRLIEDDVGGLATSPPEPTRLPQILDAHPVFLVAVYLGAVLRRVRDLVEEQHAVDHEFFYNLDIPVSRLDGGRVERAFQTALDAAVDFAEDDDLPINDGQAVWERWRTVLRSATTGMPDPQQKRWTLVPESSAVVKGAEAALAEILPDSTRYTSIVDIGAGTTDVAWFRWVVREEEDGLFFFSAKICLVGCDQIDLALLDMLAVPADDRARMLPVVRESKAALAAGQSADVGGVNRPLTPADLHQAVQEVAGRCFRDYGVSFGKAYSKEPNTDRWKDVRVILVGGGSQLEGFQRQFRRHPRESFARDVAFLVPGSSQSVEVSIGTLGTIGATSKRPREADIVFLLPALGLSYPVEEIPEPKLPREILGLPAQPRGPTGLYDYEAPDD